MKILFLTAYSELAASSRTRVYQYLPILAKKGIDFEVICFTPRWLNNLTINHDSFINKVRYWILSRTIFILKIFQAIKVAHKYDVIYIQKIKFPLGLEKILKIRNPNIIFDFDDAIFNDGRGLGMLKIAKCCIVENEYNKAIALKYCSQVEVITGPINTDRYFVRYPVSWTNPFVIGWVGSRSTIKYLYALEEVFVKLAKKYPIVLEISSSDLDCELGNDFNWIIKKWNPDEEVDFIQHLDVGIMPLPSDKWTQGKGGYKLLEYMACGIPVIASPVGINREIVISGNCGYLVDNDDEWFNAFSAMITNSELGNKMGTLARLRMLDKYSLNKALLKLDEIFKGGI